MDRRLIAGHSPYESIVGFSRAVVVGNMVYVAGTAPIPADGSAPPEGAYDQARLCLDIIGDALSRAGSGYEHVVRTRVYVAEASFWEEAGRAHGEVFAAIRPANTTVVTSLLDLAWKIEIDVDAVLP